MSRLSRRSALVLATAFAAGACRDTPSHLLREALVPMDCPADIGIGPMTADGKFVKDSTKSRYLTIIIDGKVARSNYNVTKRGPLDIPDFPSADEIRNVSMLSNSMSFTEISRKYGTCFGVGVQLIATKAGNWTPGANRSANGQ